MAIGAVAGLTPAGPIRVPAGSLVVLIGPSGSGKTTFASRHFCRTQILGSDEMRAIVADDPNDQAATDAAFELLHTALRLRLAGRRTTVVDATNVERWAREGLLATARRFGRPAIAIVLALPLEVSLARNMARPDRRPPAALRRQHRWMSASLATLGEEGFAAMHFLESEEQVRGVTVEITA